MRTYFGSIFVIVALLTGWSCKEHHCRSTNEILGKLGPEKKEYKDELARQLQQVDKSRLKSWISASWQKMDKNKELIEEHIRLHIQGDSLCAEMILRVNDANRGFTDNKNVMHEQKEVNFGDVIYEVVQDSIKTEFVLAGIKGITD